MIRRILFPVLPAALLALGACDSPTGGSGQGGDGRVSLKFGARGEAGSLASSSGAAFSSAAAGQLAIDGENGRLTLTGLRVIVAEFELDGDDDVNACQDNGGGDDCEDFDAGPLFVDLPLGAETTVASGDIPNGTYEELEFEIEDLDDDEENDAERQKIEQLFTQIRSQVPDWPRKASMLVEGTFQPFENGQLGAARPFRVFVEAELEIEIDLVPPLVVSDASASRSVSVNLDPSVVFRSGAQVIDMSQFNGRLVEWELDKVERGFRGSSSGSGSDDD